MARRKPKPTAVKKLEGNPGKRKLNAKEHITSDGSTFETDKGYQQQTPWVGIAHHGGKVPAPQCSSNISIRFISTAERIPCERR